MVDNQPLDTIPEAMLIDTRDLTPQTPPRMTNTPDTFPLDRTEETFHVRSEASPNPLRQETEYG